MTAALYLGSCANGMKLAFELLLYQLLTQLLPGFDHEDEDTQLIVQRQAPHREVAVAIDLAQDCCAIVRDG
jgi:hypothetical protein